MTLDGSLHIVDEKTIFARDNKNELLNRKLLKNIYLKIFTFINVFKVSQVSKK